jgi:hypothetical protein
MENNFKKGVYGPCKFCNFVSALAVYILRKVEVSESNLTQAVVVL